MLGLKRRSQTQRRSSSCQAVCRSVQYCTTQKGPRAAQHKSGPGGNNARQPQLVRRLAKTANERHFAANMTLTRPPVGEYPATLFQPNKAQLLAKAAPGLIQRLLNDERMVEKQAIPLSNKHNQAEHLTKRT